MFCTSCGAQAAGGARFCPACGKAMSGSGARADDATIDRDVTLDEAGDNFEGATIAPTVRAPSSRKPSSVPAPSPLPRPASGHSSSPLTSSDAIGGGRFAPGKIIAERYRVVALAGRGGMGEVYRAEDLRLSQVV